MALRYFKISSKSSNTPALTVKPDDILVPRYTFGQLQEYEIFLIVSLVKIVNLRRNVIKYLYSTSCCMSIDNSAG